MVDIRHDSSLYLSFSDPNVPSVIVIAHPYPPASFPPINNELRPNFARMLMSSEVEPRYLPPNLDCSPTTSPRVGSSRHSPDRCRSLEGLFTIRTHAFFVPGGTWTMDGSTFSSCSMPTIGDRGRGSNESPWTRNDERGEFRVGGAGCILFSTLFLNLNQSRGRASIGVKHAHRSDRPPPS